MAVSAATNANKGVPSAKERLKAGRARRSELTRSKLGDMHPETRPFKPIEILLSATEGRVPKLLAIKYGRMAASPFTFFRGAVSIMAADLACEPHTAINVQLCGDAHVENLGCYSAPDGRLVFDINDFDETIEGPWEWDVKRMAASIVLAGFESGHRRSQCQSAVEAFVISYFTTIAELAEAPVLVAARHQIHRANRARAVSAALRQAQRATPTDLIAKYTENGARNALQFKKVEHVLWRILGPQRRDILASLELYRESLGDEQLHLFSFFQPVDVAFKVVGTGSVGLRDFVVLMRGNHAGDALFLQIKQEVQSAYAKHLKPKAYPHQGQRVADGQRKIQPVSDLLLGWTRIGEHDYLVRQLNDHKGSIDLTQLRGGGLTSLAVLAGELLARGHARSGDALMIKGYIGTGGKALSALVDYGLAYATITESDFDTFKKGIKDGRIKTLPPA